MTTFLFSLLTAGGDKMAVTDPHGWTLSIISVCVVFSGLIILYIIYSLSGEAFSGELKQRFHRKPKTSDAEVAAAIAMALEAEEGSETEAAIATALHLYLTESVHDYEPGIVTIRQNGTAWADKTLTLRKKPLR